MKPLMKSSSIGLFFLAATLSAQAHITPGVYQGTDDRGAICAMTVTEQFYEGARHPLNERIRLSVDGEEYVVGHPPVVDAATDTAFFNHDLFQGIQGTSEGARALVIEMVGSDESNRGPGSFQIITHKWRSNERSSLKCSSLKRN